MIAFFEVILGEVCKGPSSLQLLYLGGRLGQARLKACGRSPDSGHIAARALWASCILMNLVLSDNRASSFVNRSKL